MLPPVQLIDKNQNSTSLESIDNNNSITFGFFNPNTYRWPNIDQFSDLKSPVTTFKAITKPVDIQTKNLANSTSNGSLTDNISNYSKNSVDHFDTNYSSSEPDSNMSFFDRNRTDSNASTIVWPDSFIDYSSLESNLSSLTSNYEQQQQQSAIDSPMNKTLIEQNSNHSSNARTNQINSNVNQINPNVNQISSNLNQISSNASQIDHPRKITKHQTVEPIKPVQSSINVNQTTSATDSNDNLIQNLMALNLISSSNVQNSQNSFGAIELNNLNNSVVNSIPNDKDLNQLIRWLNFGRLFDALSSKFGMGKLINLLAGSDDKQSTDAQKIGTNANNLNGNNVLSYNQLNQSILNQSILNHSVLNQSVLNQSVLNQSVLNAQPAMIKNDSAIRSSEVSQNTFTPGRISKGRRRALTSMECVFCKNNGLSKEEYQNHILKDPEGIILCPRLRKYNCPICQNGGGPRAHTVRYCPKNRPQAERRDQLLQSLVVPNAQNIQNGDLNASMYGPY